MVEKLADTAAVEYVLAHPPGSRDLVVLKVLRAELAENAIARGRFWDQAVRCAKLSHPHIVQHLAADTLPDGRPFLVTEYLEGEDLASHLGACGPLMADALPRLFAPLCHALEYLHAQGIVHRDIKPETIFLCGGLSGFMPKLTHFGVAHFDGPKVVETASGARLTDAEYMPPECIDGKKADARSDLYALGVVMFESLAGKPPFSAPSQAELLLKHLQEPPPPLPEAAQSLAPIVLRCLAKNPDERFQSAAELRAALAQQLAPPVAAPEEAGIAGNYELVRLLGKGSMSVVYLGRHVRLGKQVAIKVLRPEHSNDRELTRRFFQEAQAVNRINHEHIVEIHDFVEESSRAYCVMELLNGQTLAAALKKKTFTIARAVNIARQLCAALGAAHQVGVVHRDIKPENIFLTERAGQRDFVKVLDFGVAKLLPSPGELSARRTVPGALVGTPRYMSPEQAAGKPVDTRADLYAVGVVLYELLAGAPPFQFTSLPQLMVRIMSAPTPPLGALTAGGEPIPEGLREVVMACLEKAPERRPASMAQLRHLLAPWDADDRPKKPSAPVASRKRAGVLWLMLAVAACLWGYENRALLRSWAARAGVVHAAPVSSVIRLAVGSKPAGATVIRVDTGEVLGTTPLIRELPRRSGTLRIRIELQGSRSAERAVPLSRDSVVDLQLEPENPAPEPARE